MINLFNENRNIVLVLAIDEAIINGIKEALTSEWSLQFAASMAEALAVITIRQPSLIISELNGNSSDCIELLTRLRGSAKNSFMPFIVIAADNTLAVRLEVIEKGADAYLSVPFAPEELKVLVRSKVKSFKDFYLLSITDELTRLYNRRELLKKFNEEIDSNEFEYISLAIIDIDYFKQINDVYGHQTGDAVLKKLASILIDKMARSFFPARFGGEEFVVIMPGLKAKEARDAILDILKNFAKTEFSGDRGIFHVTFSGGIAEYPAMASNISELLSRADRALYAAKEDGRNRIYQYTPIMGRNDSFWEYLRIARGSFVDSRGHDSITGLPYIPLLLENMSQLPYTIKCVGVLFLRFSHLFDLDLFAGERCIGYDIENIGHIIEKASSLIFPTDTFAGISDLYENEFVLLYPSPVDFTMNYLKFEEICSEICVTVEFSIFDYPFQAACSQGIIYYNESDPREILQAIKKQRKGIVTQTDRWARFEHLKTLFVPGEKKRVNTGIIKPIYYHSLAEGFSQEFTGLSLSAEDARPYMLEGILNSTLKDEAILRCFFAGLRDEVKGEIKGTLLLPYLEGIRLDYFLDAVLEFFPDEQIAVLFNEKLVSKKGPELFMEIEQRQNPRLKGGIDNCYIGNSILSVLSAYDVGVVLFAESATRNLNRYKDRIKVIRGLTVFLEQLSIPRIVKNIHFEEDLSVAYGLRMSHGAGRYIYENGAPGSATTVKF